MHGRSPLLRCQPEGSFNQHDDRRLLGNLSCYSNWYLIVLHSWGNYFETKTHSRQYQIVDRSDKNVKVLSQWLD